MVRRMPNSTLQDYPILAAARYDLQSDGVGAAARCSGHGRHFLHPCRSQFIAPDPIQDGRDESRPYNKIHRLPIRLHFKFRKQETDRALSK
jgi:hypothetical protein